MTTSICIYLRINVHVYLRDSNAIENACGDVLPDFHRDSGAGNQHTKPSAPYFSSIFYFQMLTEYFAGRIVMF